MERVTTELESAFPDVQAQFAAMADGLGEALRLWPSVCGIRFASRSMPVGLRDGTLRVACASSTWACELQYSADEIVNRLQAASPALGVTRLVCHASAAVVERLSHKEQNDPVV